MKTVSIRELRRTTPFLKELVAREGEVVVVSNGEPIVRMTPIAPSKQRPKLPSLKAFRDAQPLVQTPIEQLIREERDRR
jgi:prevent-host-death family protein